MTREQAKELLPVIQAFAEGKTVQFRFSDGTWVDCRQLDFSGPQLNYRIKPEPREFWILVAASHVQMAAMKVKPMSIYEGEEVIHVREVLD